MDLSLMSTAVSENTARETTCMTDCLVDAGAGAPGDSAKLVSGAPFSKGLARHLTVCLAAMLLFAVAAAPASALTGSVYDTSFGAPGDSGGQFGSGSPNGSAFDEAAGFLYVADGANHRIEKFQADGTFVAAWGWGVADGNAASQVCTTGCQAGIAGSGAGQFDAPHFIAVDNSAGPSAGDVYVADTNTNLVQKFDSAGGLIATWAAGGQLDGSTATDGPFGSITGLAVDGAGTLDVFDATSRMFQFTAGGTFTTDFTTLRASSPDGLAVDSAGNFFKANGDGSVQKFGPTGASIGQVSDDGAATGLAVDPATDDLYVAFGDHVNRYAFDGSGAVIQPDSSTCTFGLVVGCGATETFGSPDIGAAGGLAVSGSSAKLYVSDQGSGEIDVFAPPGPAVTKPATIVHHTSAVLNGHLDPQGDPAITDCHFDWGTSTAYGNQLPCAGSPPFAAPADVSATLGGLTPGTTYHFRLAVSTTAHGDFTGKDKTLTPSAFPVAHSELGTFGPDGTPATTFNTDQSRFGPLAFNQSTGGLFVLDGLYSGPGSGVYGFDASAPLAYPLLAGFGPLGVVASGNSYGLAVDSTALSSAGNLYYTGGETGLIYGFDSTGAALGGNFPIDPTSNPGTSVDLDDLAVDSSGDLWVSDRATNQILRYSSDGVFLSSVDVSAEMGSLGGPYRIALDSNGDLYAGNYSSPGGGVWRYTAASGYAFATQVDTTSAEAIAVDPSTHNLYLARRGGTDIREYDAAGALLGTFGDFSPDGSYGLAVDATNHYVYAADLNAHQVRVFGPGVPQEFPSITTADPSPVGATSATLRAAVDPEGFSVTDCHFEYVTDAAFAADGFVDAASMPCGPDPGSGFGDVQVSAAVSGLSGATGYHFRIVASNSNGTANGPAQTLTTLGPRIHDTVAINVSTADADLTAQIDPRGAATTYHFEYGTTTAYGTNAPASGGSAGSGTGNVSVSQSITGLQPGTTYHFRIVATSSVATTTGPDATFETYSQAPVLDACANDSLRTALGARLPDCRAYEQVTPMGKNGNNPIGGVDFLEASDAGDAISYVVQGGIPGGDGAQNWTSFLARRGKSDWSSSGMYPPASTGPEATISGWTSDFSTVFNSVKSLNHDTAAFLSRDTDGSINTISQSAGNADYDYVGGTKDGSKVFFETSLQLVPEATPDVKNLYVVDRADGVIHLAGVLPDSACGTPPCTPAAGSFAGPYLFATGDPSSGGSGTHPHVRQNYAVSADGLSVFFTDAGTGQLYLRRNAAAAGASTIHVSASAKTNGSGSGGADPSGPQPALFHVASANASTVLFSSAEELTDNANTGSADQGRDLYSYDTTAVDPARALVDLTPDSGDPNGADVHGVVGASDDGSYVYFVANGDLDGAGPALAGNCTGTEQNNSEGSCSLYVAHAGETDYIARLDSSELSNWQPGSLAGSLGTGESTGRVSKDGLTVLVSSARRLTAYDNKRGSACPFPAFNPIGSACSELYRYHVGDPGPTCVSCNPTGQAPDGGAHIQTQVTPPTVAAMAASRTRVLSSDGNRVFFESPDKLVAADTNGDSGCELQNSNSNRPGDSCQDVYEWEAKDAGTCHSSAANGGCLYLISTGRSRDPSYFADASVSGDDVFFYTSDKLVAQDQDENVDIYDARVGGGLSVQHPEDPPPACTAEGCRAGSSLPPTDPDPGSGAFTGPGDQGKGHRGGSTATGPLKVSRPKTVRGKSTLLSIKVPSKGKIAVSGTGLKGSYRTAKKKGTYRLSATLTSKAEAKLKQKHTLKVKVRVLFKPSAGASSTATVTLTFKTAKTTKKGR